MRLLAFKTRSASVYHGQNTPASSCRELFGVCMNDAVVLIFIVIFVGGLLLLTLVRNASRRRRPEEDDHPESSTDSPPSYASIGFPPSASHDLALYKGSPSPSLDPYHVVPPSFDNSFLLKDGHFTHVPYPDRTLALASSQHQQPSGVGLGLGLGLGSARAGPSTPPAPLISPPPAYVREPRREPRRDAGVARTL
ncbi:hypothetical protein MVEN_00337900 [Mycena venus]|uniref:Transmembrane protein n=1 Tax=Mycena venus TaxID=2733690 RepID=A0A8H6YP37_9AGAR|nr:hypothetical protein MVEN_00337900 [Mycena venus]